MSATKSLAEYPEHVTNWLLTVNGVVQPPNTVWKVESPFGSVENRVVVDREGKAVFTRPEYRESRSTNLAVFGCVKGTDNEIKVAVIRQPRPHADNPFGDDKDSEVIFGQTPMGFIGKIFGEEIPQGEDGRTAASRQTGEETGAHVILNVTRPPYPEHNSSPSFLATWCELYFVEVDLDQFEAVRHDRREPIYSADFISPSELFKRIKEGIDETGAVYRSGHSNATWMTFFACHPEFFPH